MKRRALPLAFALLCLASQTVRAQHMGGLPLEPDPAPRPSDLTVAQLLAKAAAARGGEQKLNAVHSVTMAGTVMTTQLKSSPVTLTIAPGRYLRRIEPPDPSAPPLFRAVNGEEAWEVSPQLGILKPTPMQPKDAARYRRLADPLGPLVDPQAKKDKIEAVGKTSWQGSEVYKLKVTYPDGAVVYVYLDATSFLPVRTMDNLYIHQMHKDFGMETVYEDFRDVNGVKWPFTEKIKAPEAGFAQTTLWKSIEPNKPFDPAIFKAQKG